MSHRSTNEQVDWPRTFIFGAGLITIAVIIASAFAWATLKVAGCTP